MCLHTCSSCSILLSHTVQVQKFRLPNGHKWVFPTNFSTGGDRFYDYNGIFFFTFIVEFKMNKRAVPIKIELYFKILSNLWIGISHLAEMERKTIWCWNPESDTGNKWNHRLDSTPYASVFTFFTIFFHSILFLLAAHTHTHTLT